VSSSTELAGHRRLSARRPDSSVAPRKDDGDWARDMRALTPRRRLQTCSRVQALSRHCASASRNGSAFTEKPPDHLIDARRQQPATRTQFRNRHRIFVSGTHFLADLVLEIPTIERRRRAGPRMRPHRACTNATAHRRRHWVRNPTTHAAGAQDHARSSEVLTAECAPLTVC
jgi:hypothetical protein